MKESWWSRFDVIAFPCDGWKRCPKSSRPGLRNTLMNFCLSAECDGIYESLGIHTPWSAVISRLPLQSQSSPNTRQARLCYSLDEDFLNLLQLSPLSFLSTLILGTNLVLGLAAAGRFVDNSSSDHDIPIHTLTINSISLYSKTVRSNKVLDCGRLWLAKRDPGGGSP